MFRNRGIYNDMFRLFDEMFEQINSTNGEWKTQTRVSDDGTLKITSYHYNNDKDDNLMTHRLQNQLEDAIQNEDFENAVKIRDQIRNLETNQKEIDKLELELKQSIKEQNFEKSIEIRDQLKKFK